MAYWDAPCEPGNRAVKPKEGTGSREIFPAARRINPVTARLDRVLPGRALKKKKKIKKKGKKKKKKKKHKTAETGGAKAVK